jgi:hypothetical protein
MSRSLYKLPNQEIEKSIIYEIPREGGGGGGGGSGYRRYEPSSYNKIRYKVKEDMKEPKDRNGEFLCLNCHKYVHANEVDLHSIEHLSTANSQE